MGFDWIVIISVAIIAGFLNGWLGFGSLGLLVPMFIWMHGADGFNGSSLMVQALTSSFLVSALCSAILWGRCAHAKIGPTFLQATPAIAAAMAGCMLGLVMNISSGGIAFADRVFGGYLIAVAIWVIVSKTEKNGTHWPSLSMAKKILLGLAGGCAAGVAGFCGHSFFVPALHREGFDIKESVAAAQQIGLFIAIAGLAVFAVNGAFDRFSTDNFIEVAAITPLCLIAGEAGARLKFAMDPQTLARFLAAAYAAAGIFLILGIIHAMR